MPRLGAVHDPEGARYVGRLLFHSHSRLGVGVTQAPQHRPAESGIQAGCHPLCDDGRLVVSPSPAPSPMQGHRHHQVHIRKQPGRSEARTQLGGKFPSQA